MFRRLVAAQPSAVAAARSQYAITAPSRLPKAFLASRASFSSASSSSSASAAPLEFDRKVYELRTYNAHPDKFPAFIALCNEHMGTRFGYSKCLGYWTTELGGVNQTVHIWEYDSYDHRTEVRKALAADSVWMNEFMAKMRPMLQSQTNFTMKRLPFFPITEPDHVARGAEPMQGFYELRLKTLGLTEDYAEWKADPAMRAELDLEEGSLLPRPLGTWLSDVGAGNTAVQLWYWPSLNSREDALRAAADSNTHWTIPSVCAVESKILQPTAFSPWK